MLNVVYSDSTCSRLGFIDIQFWLFKLCARSMERRSKEFFSIYLYLYFLITSISNTIQRRWNRDHALPIDEAKIIIKLVCIVRNSNSFFAGLIPWGPTPGPISELMLAYPSWSSIASYLQLCLALKLLSLILLKISRLNCAHIPFP